MKKTMQLILLFVLAFSATIAVAEADFDFSGYSYDELISVKENWMQRSCFAPRPERESYNLGSMSLIRISRKEYISSAL